MVTVIENWTDVEGELLAVAESDRAGFVRARVRVSAAREVEGFANLLAQSTGSELSVEIPAGEAELSSVHPGNTLSVRVRRARDPSVGFALPGSLRCA